MRRAAVAMARRFPGLAGRFVRAARLRRPMPQQDVDERLAAATPVFDDVDLFVAPSPSIAAEFQRLGISASKIRISDYGFVPLLRSRVNGSHDTREHHEPRRPLRIGFVGTLVWHKGVHVLLDASAAFRPTPTS